MNHLLTLDLGNTNQTFALFSSNGDFEIKGQIQELTKVRKQYNLNPKNTQIILSSVKDSAIKDLELSKFTFIHARDYFKENLYLDMPVKYSQTLGDDRLFSSYFLYKQRNEKQLLIDSGTFTTIDLIEKSGHSGGYILPGVELLKTSYNRGENLVSFLPEKAHELTIQNSLPNDSTAAIEQGLLLTFLCPIVDIIQSNSPESITLTGGNCEFLEKLLKTRLRSESIHLENNLLHRSLHFISKNKE